MFSIKEEKCVRQFGEHDKSTYEITEMPEQSNPLFGRIKEMKDSAYSAIYSLFCLNEGTKKGLAAYKDFLEMIDIMSSVEEWHYYKKTVALIFQIKKEFSSTSKLKNEKIKEMIKNFFNLLNVDGDKNDWLIYEFTNVLTPKTNSFFIDIVYILELMLEYKLVPENPVWTSITNTWRALCETAEVKNRIAALIAEKTEK